MRVRREAEKERAPVLFKASGVRRRLGADDGTGSRARQDAQRMRILPIISLIISHGIRKKKRRTRLAREAQSPTWPEEATSSSSRREKVEVSPVLLVTTGLHCRLRLDVRMVNAADCTNCGPSRALEGMLRRLARLAPPRLSTSRVEVA